LHRIKETTLEPFKPVPEEEKTVQNDIHHINIQKGRDKRVVVGADASQEGQRKQNHIAQKEESNRKEKGSRPGREPIQ
jgi:hypothetical protein